MNIYERRRQQLRASQDKELSELDSRRKDLGDSEYWEAVGELYKKYQSLISEIDSSERQRSAIISAKENTNVSRRPESSYTDILSQLRAAKESELLLKLSRLDSTKVHIADNAAVDMKDPFYMDKKDPMSVFNRWWNEFLQSLPSVSEVREFLKKIDISEYGAIYFKDESLEDEDSSSSVRAVASSSGILKSDITQSVVAKRRHEKAYKNKVQRLRYPMLNKRTNSKIQESNRVKRQAAVADALRSVVDSYGLPEYTCDLLYEHIDKCCIPKGLLNSDQYANMLEQFLRNVPDNKRDSTIQVAISRGWRQLYYVN